MYFTLQNKYTESMLDKFYFQPSFVHNDFLLMFSY